MKLKIIAGNCVFENMRTTKKTILFLKQMSKEFNFDLIYKTSWKKDNRSSVRYYKGIPLRDVPLVFKTIKKYNVKTLTDFHSADQIQDRYIKYVDILQVPAYLCMQTSLVMTMAKTKKIINVKKGQFIHPEDMQKVVKKIESTGNKNIYVTERGTCFGYRDLVVDPRSFYIMQQFGYPVIFDVTHSIRKYGVPSSDLKNGGAKEFVLSLAKAAVATGYVDGLFIETHPQPQKALCDAATQLSFTEFLKIIKDIMPIWNLIMGGKK